MHYHIYDNKGKLIASFEHEADRDVCKDALEEYWAEEFRSKDD